MRSASHSRPWWSRVFSWLLKGGPRGIEGSKRAGPFWHTFDPSTQAAELGRPEFAASQGFLLSLSGCLGFLVCFLGETEVQRDAGPRFTHT